MVEAQGSGCLLLGVVAVNAAVGEVVVVVFAGVDGVVLLGEVGRVLGVSALRVGLEC